MQYGVTRKVVSPLPRFAVFNLPILQTATDKGLAVIVDHMKRGWQPQTFLFPWRFCLMGFKVPSLEESKEQMTDAS